MKLIQSGPFSVNLEAIAYVLIREDNGDEQVQISFINGEKLTAFGNGWSYPYLRDIANIYRDISFPMT